MRKFLLFEYKEAHDGTFFDCPPNGLSIDVPFRVVSLEVKKVRYPLYTQYYVYAVEG